MATPVPPPAPRHLRLLRLLLSGLVLGAALTRVTASRPDAAACPGSLDCALKRRARCPPGAHACGPCLQSFQEDRQGLCVPRKRRLQGDSVWKGGMVETGQSPAPAAPSVAIPCPEDPRAALNVGLYFILCPLSGEALPHPCRTRAGEGPPPPRLEDEIDLLAQELALKEAGHLQLVPEPLKDQPRLLEPAVTPGFSERGQRPKPGLPSPQGAPTPTPRTSLGSPVSSGPVHMAPLEPRGGHGDGLALVLLVVFCMAGTAALAVATFCWCRLQRETHLTQKADYTAAKTPSSPRTPRISPGDQRLAHSAEMYHYQHQRQQMLCLERHKEPPKELESVSSDEENEDGDFTVYECPGLAPTGEMEVRNPLFDHTSLPAPPPELCSPPPLQ